MPLRPPGEEEMREFGRDLHFTLTEDEVETFREVATDRIDQYRTIRSYDQQPGEGQLTVRERNSGRRAASKDDPYNAWVTRCDVRGSDDGLLAGWDIAIKDNICVAGVEMTCGSQVVEGYVPYVDATIVDRVLDEGANVVGKTSMDDMAMSITGYSAFGPIWNPYDDDRLAGGSSGGSAVAVAIGEADAAIGTDQGGSIRIPAAHCGVVGLKPTYGLVPYTGCMGLANTVDHPGPMATDVETTARLLTVIAGSDARDHRQPAEVMGDIYEKKLDGDVSDLSIGVLSEGFDTEHSDPAVDEQVRSALDALSDRGANVAEVSIPMHTDARAFHAVCSAEGLLAAFSGEGLGHGQKGWYNVSWIDAFGSFRRAQADEFPAALKMALIMGAYTSEEYHSKYYARALNLCLELSERYDEALSDHDLLAMPTTPRTAPEHEETNELERLAGTNPNSTNTAAFNRTGHPALSVPVEPVDGLPVGVMFVGSEFDDATVLNAGYALEEAFDRHRPEEDPWTEE